MTDELKSKFIDEFNAAEKLYNGNLIDAEECDKIHCALLFSIIHQFEIDLANDDEDIYPLTILRDRYRGTYSGGKYTAWNLEANEIPHAVRWDDDGCSEFFSSTKVPYGAGETPNEAVENLIKRLEEN